MEVYSSCVWSASKSFSKEEPGWGKTRGHIESWITDDCTIGKYGTDDNGNSVKGLAREDEGAIVECNSAGSAGERVEEGEVEVEVWKEGEDIWKGGEDGKEVEEIRDNVCQDGKTGGEGRDTASSQGAACDGS